jgi:enoyl-CoA hydratase/carnithine racemase
MGDRIKRRAILTGTAAGIAAGTLATINAAALDAASRLADVQFSPTTKLTIERKEQIVLIGINRPYIQNRIDPDTFRALAKAFYDYDHDPSLRAAVLFGHGENFSRGIDVDAFKPLLQSGKPLLENSSVIDPLGRSAPRLSKPLIVVTHGDTWNMAHELHLAADIRIASADVRFGQDENTHGRFPGGGSTIRFPRESGWGNAMRYMLTGDHWDANEAYRIGEVQEIAPDPKAALETAIRMANKVAQCGPLGIEATLQSAHLAIDRSADVAFSQLDMQYGALYSTHDFQEGRDAEAQGRPPNYQGR